MKPLCQWCPEEDEPSALEMTEERYRRFGNICTKCNAKLGKDSVRHKREMGRVSDYLDRLAMERRHNPEKSYLRFPKGGEYGSIEE